VLGALVVFAVTYLVIASRQMRWAGLDRPAGAVVGAVAMVVIGGLPADAALAAIDLHVILLLFGVLVIASYLQHAQLFRYAAYLVLTRAGSARSLLFGLVFVAGGLSALLLNDTVCVVLTPLVIAVTVEAKLPPLPYPLALSASANVGGVVSFSGNPQNMIVGAAAAGKISFAQYLLLTLPIGAACLVATAATLAWMFRRDLRAGPLAERTPPRPAVDRALCAKGIAALAVFAGLALAGVSLAGAAMAAASGLMIVASPRRPTVSREALAAVDWPLLAFFAGLFVVVAGVERTGALDDVFHAVAPAIARGDARGSAAFVGLVVVGSNIVSNVPLVLVAKSWVPGLADPTWGYVLLAVGSTLAGNLTLFGSVANIIVMERAGPRGLLGFRAFLRYGAVITAVDLAVAFGLLAIERASGYASLLGL
jgi:Na+/H+ antiporter NhaD/arsenite permease-like protein